MFVYTLFQLHVYDELYKHMIILVFGGKLPAPTVVHLSTSYYIPSFEVNK